MTDRALVCAIQDALRIALDNRFGPSAVAAERDVAACVERLGRSLSSEDDTSEAAKRIRGMLGPFARAIGGP